MEIDDIEELKGYRSRNVVHSHQDQSERITNGVRRRKRLQIPKSEAKMMLLPEHSGSGNTSGGKEVVGISC